MPVRLVKSYATTFARDAASECWATEKKLVVAIFFKVPTEKTQEVDIGTKKELTRKKIACHINVFLCKRDQKNIYFFYFKGHFSDKLLSQKEFYSFAEKFRLLWSQFVLIWHYT